MGLIVGFSADLGSPGSAEAEFNFIFNFLSFRQYESRRPDWTLPFVAYMY